ncbi:MAG: hypothetical protein LBU17_00180 [Treponema sp.]|jgi:hypothetical protein|nr:hypothetical protein [Treponema sp.]
MIDKETPLPLWVLGVLCIFLIPPAWADTPFTADTNLSLLVSTLPEAKIRLVQGFTFPCLQGTSPWTANNNIRTTLSAEVSLISLNFTAEVIWTPVAFFQVLTGTKVGSGWNINLFGRELYGIGINRREADRTGNIHGAAFDGSSWNLYAGGVFQFDLATLIPGAWHHILFKTYQEGNYRAYTAASSEDSWVYEQDSAENRNGFNYYGTYFLGYQMPLFLNTVGFMAEMNQYLYKTANDRWGDGLGRWIFSGIFNVTITKWFSATLITQFRTMRNYTDNNGEDLFYQDRHLDYAAPRGLEFYRVLAMVTFNLR